MLNGLSREQQLIILGLVLVMVAGLGVMTYRHFAAADSKEIQIEEPNNRLEPNHRWEPNSRWEPQAELQIDGARELIVHVAGAVEQEGVYKLKAGDRVMDALKLAGGAASSADLSSINLAEKVKDGQKIIVPVKQIISERRSGDPDIRGSGTSFAKVSINSVREEELCKVRGIGPITSKRIIEHRKTNGPFSKIEDIMKVKGIGKGKFEKIKEQITI